MKYVFLIVISLCNISYSQQLFSDSESLQKLTKRVDFNESRSSIAKKMIINDQIYVFDLWEPIKYKDSINWDINPYENRSWRLYFQSLMFETV